MNSEQYVAGVIAKYAVKAGMGTRPHKAAAAASAVVKEWAGAYLLGVDFSGSYAKGTAISLGTDADLFISLSPAVSQSVKELYWSLFQWCVDHGLSACSAVTLNV